MKYLILCFKQCSYNFSFFIFAVIFLLTGCDSNSTNTGDQELEVVGIEVTPENHAIIEGESKKFTGLAVTSTGDKIPFEELNGNVWKWEWSTTDPQIATFDSTGLATGHTVGDTICWIMLSNSNEVSSKGNLSKEKALSNAAGDSEYPQISRPFVGRDSFGVQVITSAEVKAKFNLQ